MDNTETPNAATNSNELDLNDLDAITAALNDPEFIWEF